MVILVFGLLFLISLMFHLLINGDSVVIVDDSMVVMIMVQFGSIEMDGGLFSHSLINSIGSGVS